MKWFLQFLSIGSAVIYTLLVISSPFRAHCRKYRR